MYKNTVHIKEPEFNRLNNRDRLIYILERFKVGMEIEVRVTGQCEQTGTVYGFYPTGSHTDGVKVYDNPCNELPPVGVNPPQCNVTVMINGKLSSYYPLWIYYDITKVRNDKLEQIGI